MAADDTAPVGTFSPAPAAPAGGDNDVINWFTQWLTSTGGTGLPGQGGMGGGNPLMGGMNPLGMGMGMDALGMGAGGMFNPLSAGLNPYQAAGLRLRRSNEMNVLRQNMANAHRGIGAAGGRDFSRHVQNIDDEIMALQEQKVQDNVRNALAYNQQLMQYGQQNLANNLRLMEALGRGGGNILRYGQDDSEQPGTFSGAEGGSDTQGTLP